jgi:hypothetical protein
MNPELTAEIKPTPKINRKESRKGIPKRKWRMRMTTPLNYTMTKPIKNPYQTP